MSTAKAAGANEADIEIADRITNALIIKNISARSVSDATGISYPTLRRSLKGGRSLTFQEFHKISAAIGVQPSTLLPDSLAERSAA